MRPKANGFTLVELVVACSLLALLAVLGWRGLDAVLRARAVLTLEMEQWRRTQLALAQIEADCANLADAAALGERTLLVADANRIVLMRVLASDGQPARLQVVRYRLKDGQLLRAASGGTRLLADLDLLWQQAMTQAALAQEVPLQTDVSAMAVRVWNGERMAWRNGANVAFDAPPGRPRARPLETGLELTLSGAQGALRKVFLLGPG